MSLSAWLDKTATHERQTSAKDDIAGAVKTWATQTASLPCAVWPRSSQLIADLLRRDIMGDHAVVTDRDIGAKSKDRLLIDGEHYLVNGVQPFSNAMCGDTLVYLMDCTKRTA